MNLIMGMFTAMAALIVGSIWNQHRESANIRSEGKRDLERAVDKLSTQFSDFTRATGKKHDDLTKTLDEKHDEVKETFDEKHGEVKETFDEKHGDLNKQYDDFKKTTEKNHETTQRKLDKITDSLADARERLARIEGHLGYGRRPRPDGEPDQDETNAA